jgi:hypothetical protein
MMARKPAERFQTPGEAAKALEAFTTSRKQDLCQPALVTERPITPRPPPVDLQAPTVYDHARPLLPDTPTQRGRRLGLFVVAAAGALTLVGACVLILLVVSLHGEPATSGPASKGKTSLPAVAATAPSNGGGRQPSTAAKDSPRDKASPGEGTEAKVERVEEVRRFHGHTAGIIDVVFSPNGRFAASGGLDKTVRVWTVATGKELWRLEGHSGDIECLCFCPDNRHLVSGSGDRTLRLWDITTGKEMRRFEGHGGPIGYFVLVTSDGKRILSSSGGADKTVRVWDLGTGKELRRFEYRGGIDLRSGDVWVAAFSPDGRYALTGASDYVIRKWDIERGTVVQELDRPGRGATISPDSRFAISGFDANNREIRLCDLETCKLLRRLPTPAEVHWLTFSPDGRRALTMYTGGDVGLWDVALGKEIHHIITKCGGRAAFSPDGRLALGGMTDGCLQLWRLPD